MIAKYNMNMNGDWKVKDREMRAEFIFADFSTAFSFMTRVAFEAERQNHHPTWTNTWNKVSIRLTTHDACDKITEKDEKLAASISGIYADFPAREK